MYTPDYYVAVIVALLFVAGVVLAVLSVRQRSRMHRQWHGDDNPGARPRPVHIPAGGITTRK
jgi:hypothetical protein